MSYEKLRQNLQTACPKLCSEISSIVQPWARDLTNSLDDSVGDTPVVPKTFTDPILGVIELFDWELSLLNSSFLQRLRGIRQLGLVHFVYPSATHDRLSHSLAVVEIAQRMINALVKNASYRTKYGHSLDQHVPTPSDEEVFAIRLAALLHDIGHVCFSHAAERIVTRRFKEELRAAISTLRMVFTVEAVSTSEVLASLMVLSPEMKDVFEHLKLGIPYSRKDQLPFAIVARIIGARELLSVSYLTGIVSGPIDADKLDYMVRDSYYTGLPIGLDVNRLISKLEIVTITPINVSDKRLREIAAESANKRFYDLGLSLSGLTAYEQMIIGRVLLYDRVYFHHKVRCAEAMMRRLVLVAEKERGDPFPLSLLLSDISDDAMLSIFSNDARLVPPDSIGEVSHYLGKRLKLRQCFNRAFSFAERYIDGLSDLSSDEERETRQKLWSDILRRFSSPEAEREVGYAIFNTADEIIKILPHFQRKSNGIPLSEDMILVDLPEDRTTVKTGVLMRTESGSIADANLFFDPEKWSKAYKNQKQCGYVFCPKEYKELVNLAAHITFFNLFGLIVSPVADYICKVDPQQRSGWLSELKIANKIPDEVFSALSSIRPRFVMLDAEDINVPADWLSIEPEFKRRLVHEFRIALASGIVATTYSSFIKALGHLCVVVDTLQKMGTFKSDKRPAEKRELQAEVLKLLRMRGCDVKEGTEIGGGETDILFPGDLILENKVADEALADPLLPNADWQSRRYSIAINRRVSFVLVAYKATSDADIPSLPKRVGIKLVTNSLDPHAVVRFSIPWGFGVPSTAKKV